MAEPIFGQKCSEDTKTKLNQLMNDSGLGGKDFMAHIVEVLELEESTQNVPELAQDMQELNVVTTRIVNIYKNLCERVENLTSDKLREYEQIIKDKDGELSQRGVFINEKLGDIDDLQKQLENTVNEKNGLLTRVKELTDFNEKNEEYVETSKNLVNEYKEKNDTLLGKLKDAEEAVKQRDKLTSQIHSLEAEAEKLKIDIKNATQSGVELKKLHAEEMARLAEKHSLELEKKLLEQERKFQEEINTIRAQANNSIAENMASVKDIISGFNKPQNQVATKVPGKRGRKPKVVEEPKAEESAKEKKE